MPQLDVFSNSYWYIDNGMMKWEYSVFVRMWHVIHRNENVILTEFSSLAALKVVILTTSNDENLVMKVSSKNFHFSVIRLLSVLSLHWRHNELDGLSDHQSHDCLLKRLFRHRSKKTPKLRVTGLSEGNSPGTGEFPAQKASNAENVSISWRHHVAHKVWWSQFMPWCHLTSGHLHDYIRHLWSA